MVVFSKVATAAVGLAAVASAAPTPSLLGGFSISQILKQVTKGGVNLPQMYARSLAKYKADIPQGLRDAMGHGSAVTTPEENDIEYLTPVQVGDTTLHLDFDTGSADLWVFSDELPSAEQEGHSLYKPSNEGSKLDGYTWEISYGDGSSASGDVYKDTVTVGGVTANGQAVEAASKISDQFTQDQNNDGLLGLAFSSINTVQPKPQKTFFDTVKDQLDKPLFAVTLKHQAPGSYDFGYIDDSKYKGELHYADIDNSQGFWMFSAKAGTSTIDAIADTGTTLIMIDPVVAFEYYLQVPLAINNIFVGGYTFPCDTELPDFTININGYDAVVPGNLIKYAPVSDGSSTCFGGIQENQGLSFSILGDIFLKSQYTVFDSEGPRIGFAPQA